MCADHKKLCLTLLGKPNLVLAGRNDGAFDSYSIAFPSVIKDGKEIFLYYTGSPDKNWSHTSIGVAWSKDGIIFTKATDSILKDQSSSDFAKEAATPAVTKIGSNYFMVLSGRKRRYNRRILGIACSDNPMGPFSLIKNLRKPEEPWEGFSIDNGTTLVKEDENTFFVYYSNCAPTLSDLMLRKTLRRRIGLLRVKIDGVSLASIHAEYLNSNPVVGLKGDVGDWNESTFCPGFFSDRGNNFFFFAASRYSVKPPYQSIGYATVSSPLIHNVIGQPEKLIDGTVFNLDKDAAIAFDSPSPIKINHEISLFYSTMNRRTNRWQVVRSTISLEQN